MTFTTIIVMAVLTYPSPVDEGSCVDVPAPDTRNAHAVRTGEQWRNPYLVVRADGVEVISGTVKRHRRTVRITELEKALRSLPPDKWPYGRIVAVQEIGLRSGSKKEDTLIEQNMKLTVRILKQLCIIPDRWPSA